MNNDIYYRNNKNLEVEKENIERRITRDKKDIAKDLAFYCKN